MYTALPTTAADSSDHADLEFPPTAANSTFGSAPRWTRSIIGGGSGGLGFWRECKGGKRVWAGVVAGVGFALLFLLSPGSRSWSADSLEATVERAVPKTDEEFFASPASRLPLPDDATLAVRLSHWLSAPVADFPRWRSYNDEACGGRTAANEVAGFVGAHLGEWTEMTAAEVVSLRANASSCLTNAIAQPRIIKAPSGAAGRRGIVYTAGGSSGSWERVLVSLRLLRHRTKSALPVEVFHYPDEDVPATVSTELVSLKAAARSVQAKVTKDASDDKHFAIKATAIIESSFVEVLSLDADNLLCGSAADLDHLFSAPSYRALGALFWPDIWKTTPMNAAWRIIGRQCRDEWEFESGQVLIDKRRHMDALLLTECMLEGHTWSPRFSDGDKDLFRWAFLALRKRWAVPGRMVGMASVPPVPGGPDWAGHTMVQHDHLGNELFVHANMLKTLEVRGYKAGLGTTWGPMKRIKSLGDISSAVIEADHLSNADFSGRTVRTSSREAVRRRAALERGFQVAWDSAPIIRDYLLVRWQDIRESQGHSGPTGPVDWSASPVEDVNFEDLPRLRGFERAFFNHGGRASYP